MKKIQLTQDKYALVDEEDFDSLNQHKWQYKPPVKENYCGYATRRIRRPGTRETLRTVYMHREIMGGEKGVQIDHRDGNGLNNQKSNLRKSNRFQNAANRQLRAESTTRVKGVSLPKLGGKYRASIGYRGRRYHLGCFSDIKEAAQAYNEAALKYYGEFARLNEI